MSVDGSTIVSNPGKSPEITVWNARDRSSLRLTYQAPVAAFGVRGDGAQLAAISGGRLQWLDRAGKVLGSVAAPAVVESTTLVISDDGRTIATFSERANNSKEPLSVTLVDTRAATSTTVVTGLTSEVLASFSPDGTQLVVTDDYLMQTIDVASKRAGAMKEGIPTTGFLGMAFDPTGDRLLMPTRSGETYVLATTARNPLARALPVRGVVEATNADRTRVVVFDDRSVTVLDGSTGEILGRAIPLATTEDSNRAAAVDPSGRTIVVLDGDQLRTYDVESGTAVGPATRVECGWSGALRYDGRTVRIYHAPRVVTVVDVAQGRARRDEPCPATEAHAAVDREGRYVVFAVDDEVRNTTKLTLWDIARDQVVEEGLDVRGDGIYTLPVLSPGGRFILAGMTVRFEMRVFDRTSQPPSLGSLAGMFFPNDGAFSDDGTIVAMAQDSTFTLFDIERRSKIGTIGDLPGDFGGAVIGPTGESAIAYSSTPLFEKEQSDLVMIDLRPATLVAAACELANRNLTDDETSFYLASSSPRATCPMFPREPRSPHQLTNIPVVSADPATTVRSGGLVTTTAPASSTRAGNPTSTTRVPTTTHAPTTTRGPTTTRAPTSTRAPTTTRG
jgi:hypothetical protein